MEEISAIKLLCQVLLGEKPLSSPSTSLSFVAQVRVDVAWVGVDVDLVESSIGFSPSSST